MPAALFSSEMERSNSAGLEDQRALQLALELSMLGLQPAATGPDQTGTADLTFPAGTTPDQLDAASRQPMANATGPKKSQNTTECVPVPSSEHVAEIVGRQGQYAHEPLYLTVRKPGSPKTQFQFLIHTLYVITFCLA